MNPRSQLLATVLVVLATPAFAATYNFSSGVYTPGVTAPNPLVSPDVLQINAGGFKYFDGVNVTNQSGTVNWNANELYFQNGAVFNNASLWDAKSNDGLVNNGGVLSTFNNTGTFRKSAGVGATTVGAIAFVNSGTIDAQTGAINFSGGNATFNAGSVFTGAGSIFVSSNASFNGAFTASNLALTAGTFTGGAAQIGGNVNFVGGRLAGTWTVGSGQTLTGQGGAFKYVDGVNLTNNGSILWQTANSLYFENSASVVNNGLFDFQASATLVNNGGVQPSLTNSATGTIHSATSQTGMIGAIAFTNNGGTLTADGTLVYSGGSTAFNNGTLFNGSGTNLVTNNASFAGTITSTNLLLQSGTFTGNAAVLNGTTAFTGGRFAGTWNLASGQAINVNSGGFKYLDGATFTNQGAVNWQTSNDFYFENSAHFINQGAFNIQSGTTLVHNGGTLPMFTNTGSVNVAANQSGVIGGIAFVNNGGTLTADSGGALNFNGSNASFNHGSTFSGAGAIAINTNASFAGTQNTSNLSLRNGTLTGSNAALQGTAEFTGGRFAGTWNLNAGSTLTVQNGAFKYLDGASTTFTNNGTVAWQTANSFYFENAGTFNNAGLFDMQTGVTLTHNGGAATTFNNTGTLRVAAGQSSSITGGGFGLVSNAGTFDVGVGGTLNVNNGNTSFNAGTQFTGAGAVALNSNANFNGSFTSQNLSLRGGTYTGNNAVANGTVEFAGGLITGTWNVAAGATVNAVNGGFKYLDGAATTFVNHGTFNWQTANSLYLQNGATLDNRGTMNLATDSAFANNGGPTPAIINTGTFQKTGGASTSNINVPFTNNGLVDAQVGRIDFNTASGIQGTGTLQIGTAGAVTLSGPSTVGVINHNGSAGGSLTLGANTVTVSSDYTNANFGTGNSFNRRANVSTSGVGNRILAAGDVNQGVSGAGVTNGTTATPTLTIGNVRVGANTVSYNIDNTGTTGPALRGAIQTSVNGGSITDARLTGSGVTAGNWGPVAAGGSASQGVTFTVNSAGVYAPLAGQAVSIVNNFDNTRSQVLAINSAAGAAAYQAAQANTLTTPINLGNVRVGDTLGTNLSVTNVAPNTGSFTETLGATVTGTTGGVVTAGSVNALAQGATSTAISAGFNTATAGARSGGVTVGFTSNEINNSGLGTIGVGSQTVNLTGNVYRLAEATLGTINFGNVLVGSSQTHFLSVSNSALADGFSEGLNAAFGAFSGPSAGLLSGSGAITNLAAGASNNTTLAVTLNTNSAGTVTASVQVLLASNGDGTSGLGLLALPTQNVPISGLIQANVGNLASASAATPNPVNLGNVRVGDAAPSQTLSLTNVQAGPAEGLNASITTATPGLTASGSFANLAPGATNSSSLSVSMNTATAGSRNGTATIALASDGSFNSGVETTLPSQTVNVTGAVYQAAQSGALPALIDLGTVRSGTVVNTALAVSNVAANTGGFTETLGAGFGTLTPDLMGIGSVSGIGSGVTSNAMSLQFTAGAAGTYNGSATLNFISQEINGSGLGNLALASQTVNVAADVNAVAVLAFQNNSGFTFTPIGVNSALLDFGTLTSVSSLFASLDILNGAFGPSDSLLGSFNLTGLNGSVFSFTGASSFDLDAGEGSPFGLTFSPTADGLFTASFAINSASHNAFQSDLALATYSITVRGQLITGSPSAVPDSSVSGVGALTLLGLLVLGHRHRRRESQIAAD